MLLPARSLRAWPALRLRPGAALLALAVALAVPACGQPGSGSGAAPTSTGAAPGAPRPPAPETTLFAASKPVLADLPAMKLVPKTAVAAVAARDPATLLAKLTALNGFGETKDALAKELDTFVKEITKDLPDIAALAQSGVDLSKPVGVVWADPTFDTAALFAAVSDEPALRRWIEERAKASNGKREIMTVGDATVLRARRDVTRAVVVRRGHVFWVRSRDGTNLDEDRVIAAADALAKTEEADSLAADPAFGKTLGTLAFGSEIALYVHSGHLASGILDVRKREAEAAGAALEEARAELAEAERRKRKVAAERARSEVEAAERKKRVADAAAKDAEGLAGVKEVAAGLGAGVELGEREIRIKGFLAIAGDGAPNAPGPPDGPKPVKLFAPLHETAALFDPALAADTAVHFAADPRLVHFLLERASGHALQWSAFPVGRARAALRDLGVQLKELEPHLDGEVSAATHRQRVEVSTAEDAGPPPSTSTSSTESDGYSVLWGLADPAAATALLEAAWKKQETGEPVAKGHLKRVGEASFELASPSPARPTTRIRIAGRALLVTTHPALAASFGAGAPAPPWMTASDHPVLKPLSAIEGASAVLAFAGVPRRDDNLLARERALQNALDVGVLSALLGPETPKSKKLREQRRKLQDQLRDLERALEQHRETTWKTFEPRLGKTVLYAKPVEGGVAVYGGVFTPEPSLTTLAEAALAAWQSAGPRWERWREMADLKKKIRDVDDLLDAERQKSMDRLIGDVLGGLGASDRPSGPKMSLFGRRGGRGLDDGEIGAGSSGSKKPKTPTSP